MKGLRIASIASALCSLFIFVGTTTFLEPAKADDYASLERVEAARGHFARARALLVEALAEFERGRRVARPDVLLDPEEWRLSVISRTEELNRLLDPQPRVTRSGVRYQANKLLIRSEQKQPPAVPRSVRSSNTYGEEQRARELLFGESMKMAPTPSMVKPEPKTVESEIPSEDEIRAMIKEDPSDAILDATEPEELESDDELLAEDPLDDLELEELKPKTRVRQLAEPEDAPSPMATSESPDEPKEVVDGENMAISKAIEEAIKARLDKRRDSPQ